MRKDVNELEQSLYNLEIRGLVRNGAHTSIMHASAHERVTSYSGSIEQ